jgi:cell division protein ZapA (FtsZ GTPase activity inhibitor)
MMKKELRSYRVTILGEEYSLMSDETEEHIVESANYVHILLQDALRKAPYSDPKKITILIALKLASELLTKQTVSKQQEEKTIELLQDIDRLVYTLLQGNKAH